MKSYTDLEQSNKLAEILPLDSADMNWHELPSIKLFVRAFPYKQNNGATEGLYPCWSLAALLNVLPYPQLSKDKIDADKTGWMVSVYPNNCRYDSRWYDNPIDACVDTIVKLHEQNQL